MGPYKDQKFLLIINLTKAKKKIIIYSNIMSVRIGILGQFPSGGDPFGKSGNPQV
jgi:hypothetical protein